MKIQYAAHQPPAFTNLKAGAPIQPGDVLLVADDEIPDAQILVRNGLFAVVDDSTPVGGQPAQPTAPQPELLEDEQETAPQRARKR